MKITYIMMIIIQGILLTVSCNKLLPPEPKEDQILDGPIEGLTDLELRRFVAGDEAFEEFYTIEMGLGPLFMATSCESCHLGDGKGHPFSSLVRFGQSDTTGNQFLHLGGPQLQTRAIPGYEPKIIPEGATSSLFLPPITAGLGYLQYVSDADIISMSEEQKPYGIKGRPNWINIPDYVTVPHPASGILKIQRGDGKYIGRFGLKASVFDLLQQTVTAFNEDMGITSRFKPIDAGTGQYMDPEVSNQKIHDVVFYLQTLKAPTPRNTDTEMFQLGQTIFNNIGCETCHKSTLTTSFAPIKALSYQTFHPYTDLLIHDLGAELDDGYTEGTALTSEWRTAPLWGLGLAPDSQGGRYFLMHDGRANSIDEAINLHGGTASQVRQHYRNLSSEEKEALIFFLESL